MHYKVMHENINLLLTTALLAIFVFSLAPVPVQAAPAPLFSVTLIAPGNANITRRQWGQIIANSMNLVGINAKVVFLTFGTVISRVFTPPANLLGKVYDDGGYDIELIGWTPGALPIGGDYQIYFGKNLPPNSNYMLWQNSTADTLLETAVTEGYTTAGLAALNKWQVVQFQDLPASQILFNVIVLAANKGIDFHGYDWFYGNIGSVPEFLSYPGKTSFTYASTGELGDLNPPISNSFYDTLVFSPIFESMFTLDAKINIKPALATSVDVSPDKHDYTYHLRSGVLWHDGIAFNAEDVLFGLLGVMNYNTGTQGAGYYSGFIGNDLTFTWLNQTKTRLTLNNDKGTAWYGKASDTPKVDPDTPVRTATIQATDPTTVKVHIANFGTLPKPAAIYRGEGDGWAVLPKHFLESVPAAAWKTHTFNTGSGSYVSNGQTFKGPIGTGPYKFVDYNTVTAVAHLTKFSQYWNKTALEAKGWFGITDYYHKYIVAKDPAEAALKNGEVDGLDGQYQMQKDAATGVLSFASVYRLPGSGVQQMGYNMRHPVFGTGVATPLGRSNPAKAAFAARLVRQAFDYLIPRQLIVENLLNGFADPADVHVAPGQYHNPAVKPRDYNPDLAKRLLATAGYQTGANPLTGEATAVPNFLQGMPIVVSGGFSNPTTGAGFSGFVVVLQRSTDNKTWTGVATATTDATGSYTITYVPKESGKAWYRVFFPGVTAEIGKFGGASGPNYDYSKLPTVLPPVTGAVFAQSVTSLSDILAGYTPKDTTNALQNKVKDLTDANSALQTTVTNLQGQIATLTNVAYGAIVLAIVVGIAGFLFARRRQPTT